VKCCFGIGARKTGVISFLAPRHRHGKTSTALPVCACPRMKTSRPKS
jgi:hypothetical protein